MTNNPLRIITNATVSISVKKWAQLKFSTEANSFIIGK